MNKLILTRGIPGSGKTTWAKAWVDEDPGWRIRVNRDDLRMLTYGKYVLERHQEETLTGVQRSMVETALRAKLNVVVDDTNLTAKFVKDWLRLAKKLDVEVEFKDFEISLEEALKRNWMRGQLGGREVPENVVRSFFQRFGRKGGQLPPPPVLKDSRSEFVIEPYVEDKSSSLPRAYIVDIDGTLANMEPCGRGPFEWHRVGEDEPIDAVIELVETLHMAGYKIIFMSGRDEVCRPETEKWLAENLYWLNGQWTSDDQLFMRWTTPKGENDPKDNIVKYTLFDRHIRGKYNVAGVIDDRQQVVDMWRDLGLTVFQCAPGDF